VTNPDPVVAIERDGQHPGRVAGAEARGGSDDERGEWRFHLGRPAGARLVAALVVGARTSAEALGTGDGALTRPGSPLGQGRQPWFDIPPYGRGPAGYRHWGNRLDNRLCNRSSNARHADWMRPAGRRSTPSRGPGSGGVGRRAKPHRRLVTPPTKRRLIGSTGGSPDACPPRAPLGGPSGAVCER
jgi:hypothetical protein